MIKKHPQINHVEETENVKWCIFKVPQYITEVPILKRDTIDENRHYFR